ncbi:MAG: ORF6N domain-containing protein [Dysgonamonadaceae bacterium]|jgi:uncharacterized protein (DUF1499 family)|nr:ORF6N domain-containing protein [Dysgonamonadaceae bacterium]
MDLQPIQNKIYEIRGCKIMLDFDLAGIYETETKRLKEQVRRNIERFPDDFMFELTKQEWKILRTQIATSSWGGARLQLELINETLAELQTKNKELNKPRNPIGFTAPQYNQR